MRGWDPLVKVAGPWHNFSLKWLKEGINAWGFCCPFNTTREDDVCLADLACEDVACGNMRFCNIGLRIKRQQTLVKDDKISRSSFLYRVLHGQRSWGVGDASFMGYLCMGSLPSRRMAHLSTFRFTNYANYVQRMFSLRGSHISKKLRLNYGVDKLIVNVDRGKALISKSWWH